MTRDAFEDDRGLYRGAFCRIGHRLGINPETLRGWALRLQIDACDRFRTTTKTAQRLAEQEKEVLGLRRANAILKSSSALFAARLDHP